MDFNIVANRIEELRDEIINDLRSLVSIKSIAIERTDENNPYPFGEEVQKAMELMFSLASREGMSYKNVDNFGGHIDFGGEESSEIMGILCHLDVVPEGEGWSKDPFGGEIVDGKFYGRGAIDDKGPTIAAFYAMKALKDVGLIPEKKVRLILGLDEETNWNGMKYYLEKEKAPDFGFTPDGDFPVIHGEKGILVFDLGRKLGKPIESGIELRSLKGGNAANMVPDKGRAVIFSPKPKAYDDIKHKVEAFNERTGKDIKAKAVGKSLEITSKGVSAHGAMPELGVNAISTLMEFLGEISFVNEDVNDFVNFYNNHLGYETNGKSLGCLMNDEVSGDTILNVGVVEGDLQVIKLTINIRYPVTTTSEEIYASMEEVLNGYKLGIIKGKHEKPIYVPKDNPFIIELMDIYRKWTNRIEEEPQVIGGGTYARAAKNVFAFGPSFLDDVECAHQKDEFINVDHLITITKIYAEAIHRLANS